MKHIMRIPYEYIGRTGDVLAGFPEGRLWEKDFGGKWWIRDQELSERQEETEPGGGWAGLDRIAALASANLKPERPSEARSWEVLLQ